MVYTSKSFITLTIALMLFGCAKDEAIYLDCEGNQFVIYPEKGLVDIIFDNSPYQINLETGSSYYSFHKT